MQFSVVIPAYNAGHILGRALSSILRQSLACEIVLIDDGSTDDTSEVVKQLKRENAALQDCLRYVRQTNGGPSSARNHGIRTAGGNWIAFLDADDYWYAGKLARQVAFMKSNPGAAVYFAGVDLEDADGFRTRKLPPITGAVTWEMMTRENLVPSPTPLVYRDALVDVGGFDENRRYAEDWDLWLRLVERGPLMAQREALASYLDSETGLHRDPQMLDGSWSVLCASLARMRTRDLRPGVADRAFANLLRDQAYSHWREGRLQAGLDVGWRAVRHDWRQLSAVGRLILQMGLGRLVEA